MKGSQPSPLKFLTPSQLVMCLILFFLPWVEIQCPMTTAGPAMGPVEKTDPSNMVWKGVLHQSGIEIALGQVSYADPQRKSSLEGAAKGAKKTGPDGAPLLWLYPLALVAGIGIGFAMPSGNPRKYALLGCCAVALLVAGGQAAMGMPIMKGINELREGIPPAAREKESIDDIIRLKYKFPFYLSMFLATGGLVTALLEPSTPTPTRPRDDDDEDDDRPRRRRR